ncbi:MAG: hypothetical protein GXY04_04720 [Acholeplasmataceae bacterium]|nr:hypothetical protein [Acholeplasmataceae bacterium]
MKLPSKIVEILNIFKKENIDAYVVGGAIRDLVLGKKPGDFDIATSASPEIVQALFQDYPLVLIGVKHGTVGIFYHKTYVEVTTFRKEENYSDHRHPEKISFINDLKADLSRRDFTINALAYKDKLYDYFGGLEDISKKIIRTVGNPFLRFEEDGLRILRALRFASTLDFTIEENTKKAIFACKDYILYAKYERINVEFNKLLLGDGVYKVLLNYYPIIATFIPRITETIKKDEEAMNLADTISRMEFKITSRLAAFYSILAPYDLDFIYSDLQRLRYSKKISYQVKDIVSLIPQLNQLNEIKIKKMLKKYPINAILTAVTIKELTNHEDLSELKATVRKLENQCYQLKQMKVKGDDLIALGITEPLEIKRNLEYLLNEIIEERLPNDKEVLLKNIRGKGRIKEEYGKN